ncbi:DUF6436 domain-containing protein [Rheinheimera baltica]|uniref:DUF6436 domain-containing protein n=1 Tax=Rheinheimera baltica TaxID=67576 RepID=UPI0004288777|nr:DUF6436 domain-containing protein [Rheinheimera baltica]MDP5141522.1 DUF6436 domain-containing protein [Rheinheimera baltica]MDP5190367.1 DUF6436 domain-containing protein [Rheinheimera baltica]
MTYRNRIRLVSLIFFLWLISISAGLFFFGNQNYGIFDSAGMWYQHDASQFSITQLGIDEIAGTQVVHVRQEACPCNKLTDRHKEAFSRLYHLPDAVQFEREMLDIHRTQFRLPATPAILIFRAGKLIYAGPYSSGPMCSGSNSFIAPIIRDEMILKGAWLNGEVNTCRCVVNSTS